MKPDSAVHLPSRPASAGSMQQPGNDIFHFSIINLPFFNKALPRPWGRNKIICVIINIIIVIIIIIIIIIIIVIIIVIVFLFYFVFYFIFIKILSLELLYYHYHYRYRYCYRHHYSFNIKDISFILQQIHWLERRKRKKKTRKVKILFQIFRQSNVEGTNVGLAAKKSTCRYSHFHGQSAEITHHRPTSFPFLAKEFYCITSLK